jgi:predicted transcriptional regulator
MRNNEQENRKMAYQITYSAATRLEQDELEKVREIAEKQDSTISKILRKLVLLGLAEYERTIGVPG